MPPYPTSCGLLGYLSGRGPNFRVLSTQGALLIDAGVDIGDITPIDNMPEIASVSLEFKVFVCYVER